MLVVVVDVVINLDLFDRMGLGWALCRLGLDDWENLVETPKRSSVGTLEYREKHSK